MTLLAAQKATAAKNNRQGSVQTLESMATTRAGIMNMIASNLSFLNELAKKLPRVAAAVSQSLNLFRHCS
jgi:hypothetical protein